MRYIMKYIDCSGREPDVAARRKRQRYLVKHLLLSFCQQIDKLTISKSMPTEKDRLNMALFFLFEQIHGGSMIWYKDKQSIYIFYIYDVCGIGSNGGGRETATIHSPIVLLHILYFCYYILLQNLFSSHLII